MSEVKEKFEFSIRQNMTQSGLPSNIKLAVNIKASDRPIYAAAQQLIDDVINRYATNFAGRPSEQYLQLSLVDLAVKLVQADAERTQLHENSAALLAEINSVLK